MRESDTYAVIVAFGLEHCKRGVETHARMLFEKLLAEKIPVKLIKGSGAADEREIVLSVPKRHTLLNRFLGRLRGYNVYWEQVFFMFRLAFFFLRNQHSIDVVYTQEYVHLIGLSKLKRLMSWKFKLVYCEGFVTQEPTRVRYADELQEINRSNYDRILPEATKQGVPVKLIPHFFDPIWEGPIESLDVLDEIKAFKGDQKLLLYVGPTELAEKNFERLEEDLISIDTWRLLICGDVPDQHLQSMIAKGIEVKAVYVSHALMQRIYPIADLFVLPSLNEAFGIATIEAMGHGLPVLLHETEHSLWLCGDKNQCIDMTRRGVIAEYVNSIKDISSYKEEVGFRNQMYFIQTFTWEVLKEEYIELFKK